MFEHFVVRPPSAIRSLCCPIALLSDRFAERLSYYLIVYQSFSERSERSFVFQRVSAVLQRQRGLSARQRGLSVIISLLSVWLLCRRKRPV